MVVVLTAVGRHLVYAASGLSMHLQCLTVDHSDILMALVTGVDRQQTCSCSSLLVFCSMILGAEYTNGVLHCHSFACDFTVYTEGGTIAVHDNFNSLSHLFDILHPSCSGSTPCYSCPAPLI